MASVRTARQITIVRGRERGRERERERERERKRERVSVMRYNGSQIMSTNIQNFFSSSHLHIVCPRVCILI